MADIIDKFDHSKTLATHETKRFIVDYTADVATRILKGENHIKVIREFREYSQTELAEMIGRSKQWVSQIESGYSKGGLDTLKKIAEALRVDVEALIFPKAYFIRFKNIENN